MQQKSHPRACSSDGPENKLHVKISNGKGLGSNSTRDNQEEAGEQKDPDKQRQLLRQVAPQARATLGPSS